MSLSLTDYDQVLKDYYTDDEIAEQTYSDNPFFAMIPKEQAGGRQYIQPVEYGRPGGASAVYATAKNNANNVKSKYQDFVIPRQKQYQRVEIDNELLYATDSPRGSFRKAFDEFDRGFRSLGEKVGRRLYRTTGGSCGQLAATTTLTGAVAILTDKADVFNFEIGDQVNFAAADGTGSLRDTGTVLEVTDLDYELGTVTFGANLNTITGIAVGDFLFMQDDFGVCLAGLESYFPQANRATALTTSFMGIASRAPNPVRLAGISMDGTKMGGLDEVLIKLVGRIAKHGGQTSHIFANPETLTDLQLTSNAKVLLPQEIYTKMTNDAGEVIVGFAGFKVQIGGRTVRVYGDRNCPSNRIWAIQMNTLKLYHAGDPVNWLGEEWTGQKLTKSQDADTMFADLGNYSNVGCSAPAWNGGAIITPSNL